VTLVARRARLLRALADGRYHAAEALEKALGVGRRELWVLLRSLADLGLAFESSPGRGYRLGRALELLDRGRILSAMAGDARRLAEDLEILPEIDSTNRYLLAKAGGPRPGHVCLAEYQSAGRGRQGRRWASPYGCNLYLSVGWQFQLPPSGFSALGVACAVAVARAAASTGLGGVGLKWPNDVLFQGRKLGGILLEFVEGNARARRGVIGVGLNVRMPAPAAAEVDQPWTDVATALGKPVSRNELAGAVIGQLLLALGQFEAAGPAPFIEQWRRYDIMPGKTAVLRWHNGHVCGVVQGINPEGELALSIGGETRHYAYGEVSLRPEP